MMIRKILTFLALALTVLLAVLVINTIRFKSKQIALEARPAPELPTDALTHFQQAITFRTISNSDSSLFDSTQFLGFHKFLEAAYPNVHSKLSREKVDGYSLLYKWEGSNNELNPIILMAHQDVVPIEEATKVMWTVDPFGGEVKDNFIWGRGTADDKINLISMLESTEKLLKENFQPDRTIYLAFGHDEELGGGGARVLAALLKSRNVHADLVLDEGTYITREKVPGITTPVALIGTSEKGFLSLELTVEINGGHSSFPEKETSIDVLSKALVNLRSKPFNASFSESTQGFLDHIGPEMPLMRKMVFANQWLFKSTIINIYQESPVGNALVRTTMVPTIIQAGMKDNVIPTVARAIVNLRLLPGDKAEDIVAEVKLSINDNRVRVGYKKGFYSEASGVTPEDSYAYRKIDSTIKRSFSPVITSPSLMIGGTDSRYFGEISSGIIKFSPVFDPIGFHGIDERISLEGYRSAIWFYEQLIRDLK
jgi:carboxypeptidase PM20D1